MTYPQILRHCRREEGESLLRDLEGKNPAFVCAMGNTETALIPGVSATTRGGDPRRPYYVPALDSELLLAGRCHSRPSLFGPGGLVGPAIITRSNLELGEIPAVLLDAGMGVKPPVPYLTLHPEPGGELGEEETVPDPLLIYEKAVLAGKNLRSLGDYLVAGECIPGGTTTAMGVLLALGIDARERMASSLRENPTSLKVRIVEEALSRRGVEPGSLRDDPFEAVRLFGDPTMPALAGITVGFRKTVLLSGGTQMAAVLAILRSLRRDLDGLAVATTRWLAADPSSDLSGLLEEIGEVPLLAADLDFTRSRYPALRTYEAGMFKEGTGAGGTSIAVNLKSQGEISMEAILRRVEENYQRIVEEGS
jgi:uncharacterized protein (TIGR00303 family)